MEEKLRLGAIFVGGWLKEALIKNMEGCIGHLDELVPELLVDQDIYGKDRLGKDAKLIDLGQKAVDPHEMEGTEEQYLWWNSESQSNWKDGYCRSAFLLDYEPWKEKAVDFVAQALETQDADGYLGIYREELRFLFETENGELWAQSTLLRVLLGYYEIFHGEEVLKKIVHAANRIMEGYPIHNSHPFCVKDSFAGHCHGLTIVDALYRLYRITGDKKYMEYAVWLYEDFSAHQVSEEDLKMCNVCNPHYYFKSHGVHTYEHIRALTIAAYEKKEYMPILQMLLVKLSFYLTPSGGPIGDEWIAERTADASTTGYEFCSVHELMNSYLFLVEMSGELVWADRAEWLYYNAAQGMMHPRESSIMYCKTDNCYEADEHRCPGDGHYNPRYKYSPTHQEAAVCCVPNAGRITPYFIEHMFLKTKKGFQAVLYGPCTLQDTWQGTAVTIRECTEYPFAFDVRFEVTVSDPVEFALLLRFPEWADQLLIDGQIYEKKNAIGGRIIISKIWEGTTVVEMNLECAVQPRKDFRGDVFISRGPLVYALPIPEKEILLKKLRVDGFCEKAYLSTDKDLEKACIREEDLLSYTYKKKLYGKYWDNGVVEGKCTICGKEQIIQLVPMGHTILRKVTFPLI